MKINDIEYVKKEEYDKLSNEKKNRKDYLITDCCNVCAIVPFERDEDLDKDIIEIEGLSTFKKVDENIKVNMRSSWEFNTWTIKKSKYSWEYLNKFKNVAGAWDIKDSPEFYMRYENNEFMEDNPIVVKIGRLVFLLAPRVEN